MNESGAVACRACPSGQVSLGANESCKACPEGTYPAQTAATCLSCSTGKHVLPGQYRCEQDDPPSYVANPTNGDIGSSSSSSSSSQKKDSQPAAEGTSFANLPLGYVLGLGILAVAAFGTGVACCGCTDMSCCQRTTSHLRRLIPSSRKQEPAAHRAWDLRKLDSITHGSDEVLRRFVRLKEGEASKSLGAVVLSASYAISGDEIADKNACFDKAGRLVVVSDDSYGPADSMNMIGETSGPHDASRQVPDDDPAGDSAAGAAKLDDSIGGKEEEVEKKVQKTEGDDWEEHFDDHHELPYFFHVPSQTSVWERPACLEPSMTRPGSEKSDAPSIRATADSSASDESADDLRCPAHIRGYTFFDPTESGLNPSASGSTASNSSSEKENDAHDGHRNTGEALSLKPGRPTNPQTRVRKSLSTRRVSFQDRLPSGNPGAIQQMFQEARAFGQAPSLSRQNFSHLSIAGQPLGERPKFPLSPACDVTKTGVLCNEIRGAENFWREGERKGGREEGREGKGGSKGGGGGRG